MQTRYFLTALLWLVALSGFAQQVVLKGQVVDCQTRQPVPFATVGVPGKEWGAAADEQGKFQLAMPMTAAASAQLLVSCVGYESAHPAAAGFLAGPSEVALRPTQVKLGEVTIRPGREKLHIVGRVRSSKQLTNALYTAHNLVSAAPARELGVALSLPRACRLQDVNFEVAFNTLRSIRLYVQLYRLQAGYPGAPLLSQSVVVDVAQKRGWVKVDLEAYQLQFERPETIVVAVQWRRADTVAVDRNAFVLAALPGAAQRRLARNNPQEAWRETKGAAPCVYITASTLPAAKSAMPPTAVIADTLAEPISQLPPPPDPLLRRYHFGDSLSVGHYVPVAGGVLYYESYGQGEPLLLLHGNGQSINAFNRQIQELAQHFQVIALDTRGHGRSTDTTPGDWTYDLLAEDVKQLLDALQIRRVKMIGWSDGGNTALRLALLHPSYVDRMAIMGANLFPTREAIAGWLLLMLENARDYGTFGPDAASRYARKQIKLVLQEPHMRFEELKAIRSPVLVLAGEADVVLSVHTQGIAAHIPQAELTIFKGASHFAPQQIPRVFNQRVLTFLQSRKL